jgi:hypothetical protein
LLAVDPKIVLKLIVVIKDKVIIILLNAPLSLYAFVILIALLLLYNSMLEDCLCWD